MDVIIAIAKTVPSFDTLEAYLQPFVDELDPYTSTEIGQTTAPIDALNAFTEETSGAKVQADAAVFELTDNGIPVEFHLSGAMNNRKVAESATPADPVMLTVNDIYTLRLYPRNKFPVECMAEKIHAVTLLGR